MKLDDALEVLGIDAGSDPKQARRAYLRLIKKHKPETDPEGFRRAREAYETVEAALEIQASAITWSPPAEPSPPPDATMTPPRAQAPQPETLAREALRAASREGRGDDVLEPAHQALDQLTDRAWEDPIPTLDLLTRTVLRLDLAGFREAADDLRRRLIETQQELQLRPQQYDESLALRWLTMTDLPRLPPLFPDLMRRELIEGALEGDVDQSVVRLSAFCEENPHLAHQWIWPLQQAPSLAGLYTDALSSPSSLQSMSTESPSVFEDLPSWAGWLAFPLFFVLTRGCIGL